MEEDTLADMVLHMEEDVGLVYQMPYTADASGMAAALEKIFFGTFQARYVLIADLFGLNSVTGMSCLMRKRLLDARGGLEAFGCYLAEDFFLAQAIADQKFRLTLSSRPAVQNTGGKTIGKFEKRISRWIRLRFAMMSFALMTEPFTECMVSGALASLSAYFLSTSRWDKICQTVLRKLFHRFFLSDPRPTT